jgi:hypothetical protein
MSQTGIPPFPKLPLGETISLSYAWFFQKFADVLRIAWLWLLLCAVVIAATSWLQWTWFASIMAGAPEGTTQFIQPQMAHPFGFVVLTTLVYIVVTLGTVSIAVAWHRRIILDEQPGLSGGNIVTSPLWHYIGIGVLLGLLFVLPFVIILLPFAIILGVQSAGTPGHPPSGIAFLVIPLALILYTAGIAVMLRLIVLLPARAIGDLTLTFRQAWRRTGGNIWRMFWGLVACTLPPLIVLEILFHVVMAAIGFSVTPIASSDDSLTIPVLGLTIMNTTLFVLYVLIVPIYIGFLSHAYRHFFQDRIGRRSDLV